MAHDLHTGEKDPREQATVARYNSECPLCRTQIQKDADTILPIEGDEWAHADCVEAEGLEPRPLERGEYEKPGWWEA